MHVEDCLEKLNHILMYSFTPSPLASTTMQVSKYGTISVPGIADWDTKFISDVSNHTGQGSPLSTAQAEVCCKLLLKHLAFFDPADAVKVEQAVASQSFRHPLHQTVVVPREVRWVGGSILIFRFQYNAVIVNALKGLDSALCELTRPMPLAGKKAWRIVVDETNYQAVMTLIKSHNFQFDDGVLEFFMNITNKLNDPSSIRVEGDQIRVEINNDVLASLWLDEMEWLQNV